MTSADPMKLADQAIAQACAIEARCGNLCRRTTQAPMHRITVQSNNNSRRLPWGACPSVHVLQISIMLLRLELGCLVLPKTMQLSSPPSLTFRNTSATRRSFSQTTDKHNNHRCNKRAKR
jgi:hypothetical protein